MESTLGMSMTRLKARVARFLGWSRGPEYDEPAWSDQQQFDIDDIVSSGLHRFYRPAPIPGLLDAGYEWSFMRPYVSLTLESGEQFVPLPDDFGGIEGAITVSRSGQGCFTLPVTGDVRRLYALDGSTTAPTGSPKCAAIDTIRGTTQNAGQRNRLHVYPEADANYTLAFAYYVHGEALSESFPYHLGGAEHSETVLESCLAVAEERNDDMQGVHKNAFQERLLASIVADRRKKPQQLGYNGDRSDERRGAWGRQAQYTVTFDGTTYE